MNPEPMESKPTTVPETAKQGGAARARWAWTKPWVWPPCMLTALAEGAKGGARRRPTTFFAKHGLYSLGAARAAASQSSKR